MRSNGTVRDTVRGPERLASGMRFSVRMRQWGFPYRITSRVTAFEDDRLLGCCLLTPMDAGTVRLRQMAVPNNMQGKGVGRALMIFAENIARDLGYKKLCMHARKTALGFYEKLGYSISGEEFMEVTIPHFTMEKAL